jgi:MoaA/NifB/PqqE/SkfB family radical SAM enzyme
MNAVKLFNEVSFFFMMSTERDNFLRRIINKISGLATVFMPWRMRFPMMSKVFMPWILRHPGIIPTLVRLGRSYQKASKIRESELKKGLKVPPFLILSVTSRCNLHCNGCYAAAAGTICNNTAKASLNVEQWGNIIQEAKDLGIFGFVIAGGEPFITPNLLALFEKFKDRLFIVFTNGTLLKTRDFERLKRLKNALIVVSVEGDQKLTNTRRGRGVYEKAINTINKLDRIGIISGISVTINRFNFRYWMQQRNIDDLIAKGVHLGFFLEYIPVCNDTELILDKKENKEFRRKILNYRKAKRIFLIHSPGDEEYMGGCVSAARGFAHITPAGDLTPCPVSNIATHNVIRSSLREGLASPLFKVIRENEHLLETEGVPCALFSHPQEVEELAKQVCAYRTGD